MKNVVALFIVVIFLHFSGANASEGIVFVDQWRNRMTESSTEFVFKNDGTFYACEIVNMKVLGEIKLFRSYLKGTWTSKNDPSHLSVIAAGFTHLMASDTGSSTVNRSIEYSFLIENKKFFIVIDGKPKRELLKSSSTSDSVERKVKGNLK